MCMKFVETYQSKCKIKIRKPKILQVSSKPLFFMSKLKARGKPSTWFPREELVEQDGLLSFSLNIDPDYINLS